MGISIVQVKKCVVYSFFDGVLLLCFSCLLFLYVYSLIIVISKCSLIN